MRDRFQAAAPGGTPVRRPAVRRVALALTAALVVLAMAGPSWADGNNGNHQQFHPNRGPAHVGRYHPSLIYRSPPPYVYAPPPPPPAFLYPAPPPGYVYAPPPNGYILAPPPPRYDYAPPPPGYYYAPRPPHVFPRAGLGIVAPLHRN